MIKRTMCRGFRHLLKEGALEEVLQYEITVSQERMEQIL